MVRVYLPDYGTILKQGKSLKTAAAFSFSVTLIRQKMTWSNPTEPYRGIIRWPCKGILLATNQVGYVCFRNLTETIFHGQTRQLPEKTIKRTNKSKNKQTKAYTLQYYGVYVYELSEKKYKSVLPTLPILVMYMPKHTGKCHPSSRNTSRLRRDDYRTWASDMEGSDNYTNTPKWFSNWQTRKLSKFSTALVH